MSSQHTAQLANMQKSMTPWTHWAKKKDIHSRSDWNIPILCKMCRHLDATSTGNARHTTGKPNKKYNEENQAIPWLCSDASRRSRNISCKQHGTSRAQWRIIPIQKQCTKQGRRALCYVQKCGNTAQQRCGLHNIANNQGSDVLGGWSQNRCTLHKLQWSSTSTACPRIHRT